MASDSGQKTEKPTPKRLRDARKKGQIPRSVDLVQWLTLLASSFFLPALLGAIVYRVADATERMVTLAAQGEPAPALAEAAAASGWAALGLAPLFGFVTASAIVGLVAQGGLVLSGHPLKPKFERISPKAGFKRIFSVFSLVETFKAVSRLGVLAILGATTLVAAGRSHVVASGLDIRVSTALLISQVVMLLRLAALVGSVIGLADYAFQRWQSAKNCGCRSMR